MKTLHVKIEVESSLYLKDPDSSELGRKIVTKSIELISDIGFEAFTFKKLGNLIESPESSIYRYFYNKQMLLSYLTSWYWAWTEYRLVVAINNIESPQTQLKIAIDLLSAPVQEDHDFSHINEILLNRIVFSESLKNYHSKNVDEQNKLGCFDAYKRVIKRISTLITKINSSFEYPLMLASMVIEGAHQHWYFSEHLPDLIDVKNPQISQCNIYTDWIFKILIIKNN
jgi:hypothetical protein